MESDAETELRNRRARGYLALAFVFLFPEISGFTLAQGQENDDTVLDEIVVIGTHIRQADPEGPSPVIILDHDALERTGAPTVSRALERLPFGNDGSFNDSDAFSSAIGGSGISFRGLGANAVLVLINGRRVAPYGFSFETDSLVSFVDLNSIPIGAVDRIEVLKDGVSAIYGSDAIAGVINIVLKENFSGTELEGRAGVTADSGAEETGINALWGHSGDRTSITLIGSYSNREHLYWRDRDISKSADFSDRGGADLRAFQSANFLFDDTWAAYGAECEQRSGSMQETKEFELLEDDQCVYNQNSEIAEPSIERVGIMSIANHEIRDDLTLHLEASYQNSEIRNQTTPQLFVGDFFPIDNPWNPFPPSPVDSGPFGEPPYAYSFVEAGPAVDRIDTETTRAVVSLEGILGKWAWEVGALYNKAVSSRLSERGYLAEDNINAALNGVDLDGDGLLQSNEYWNPYSSASNPNGQQLTDTLRASRFRESTTEITSIDGLISGKIMSLPSGFLKGALGFEVRDDYLHDESNQLSLEEQLADQFPPLFWGIRFDSEDDIVPFSFPVQELDGSFSPTAVGSRTQFSFFGELHIPILANLDVQSAARYENYSDFGSELSPRIAIRFRPWSRLTFRGSWGQSFRAPSLAELYLGPSAEMIAAWDPMRCSALSWVLPPSVACLLTQFEFVTSGNPTLNAEEAESLSIGFTAAIWKGLSVSANLWRIDHQDRIVSPGIDLLLDNEQVLGPSFVERNAALPKDVSLGIPGQIERVNNLYINLARNDVRGYDVDVTFKVEMGSVGMLNSRLFWTRLESSKFAFNAADPLEEIAGSYGHPKNRASLDTYLNTNDWLFGVYGRWTDGYENVTEEGSVASHIVWDSQISNFSINNIRITLGVNNLFNKIPPLSVGTSSTQGFNTQYYSMRGRTIYGRITVSM